VTDSLDEAQRQGIFPDFIETTRNPLENVYVRERGKGMSLHGQNKR